MLKRTINVAKDFSRYPAGRYEDDGPYSGAIFRKNFLVPAMDDGSKFNVELDGVRGYGSSFLEEAFGGLVRLGYESSKILDTFKLISKDEFLIEEIRDYILHGGEEIAG